MNRLNARVLTLTEEQTQFVREMVARCNGRPAPVRAFLQQEYPWLEFIRVAGMDGSNRMEFFVRNCEGIVTEYNHWPYFRLTI